MENFRFLTLMLSRRAPQVAGKRPFHLPAGKLLTCRAKSACDGIPAAALM
jgi:hypothetical protein